MDEFLDDIRGFDRSHSPWVGMGSQDADGAKRLNFCPAPLAPMASLMNAVNELIGAMLTNEARMAVSLGESAKLRISWPWRVDEDVFSRVEADLDEIFVAIRRSVGASAQLTTLSTVEIQDNISNDARDETFSTTGAPDMSLIRIEELIKGQQQS